MSGQWAVLVSGLAVYAVLATIAWVYLMWLLDQSQSDVRRLARLLHPARPTLSLLERQDGAS